MDAGVCWLPVFGNIDPLHVAPSRRSLMHGSNIFSRKLVSQGRGAASGLTISLLLQQTMIIYARCLARDSPKNPFQEPLDRHSCPLSSLSTWEGSWVCTGRNSQVASKIRPQCADMQTPSHLGIPDTTVLLCPPYELRSIVPEKDMDQV